MLTPCNAMICAQKRAGHAVFMACRRQFRQWQVLRTPSAKAPTWVSQPLGAMDGDAAQQVEVQHILKVRCRQGHHLQHIMKVIARFFLHAAYAIQQYATASCHA